MHFDYETTVLTTKWTKHSSYHYTNVFKISIMAFGLWKHSNIFLFISISNFCIRNVSQSGGQLNYFSLLCFIYCVSQDAWKNTKEQAQLDHQWQNIKICHNKIMKTGPWSKCQIGTQFSAPDKLIFLFQLEIQAYGHTISGLIERNTFVVYFLFLVASWAKWRTEGWTISILIPRVFSNTVTALQPNPD